MELPKGEKVWVRGENLWAVDGLKARVSMAEHILDVEHPGLLWSVILGRSGIGDRRGLLEPWGGSTGLKGGRTASEPIYSGADFL